MTELNEIEALAGEYVLGTLERDERIAVDLRRRQDAALDRAIRNWERLLGPLSEVVAPIAPPPNLYSKIRAQIGLSSHVISLKTNELALQRRAARWKSAAIGATALAASLAGIIGWRETAHQRETFEQVASLQAALETVKLEQKRLLESHAIELASIKAEQAKMPTQYIAVMQSTKDTPAFLMTLDTNTNMVVVSAIAAPKQKDKTYEVWMVHEKMPKPKSLGVYSEGDMKPMPMDPKADDGMVMNATYAVSLEPEGGSPTGGPTGPVLFTGKLVKATP